MLLNKQNRMPIREKIKKKINTFKTTIIHPSTAPISSVKLKRVSKFYHILYNDHAGKKTTLKFHHTKESTRNVRPLLDYIHMTLNNQINGKFPHVPIIKLYILVWFQIQTRFCDSLSVRVADSGHTVNCDRKYFINKTYHKLNLWISERFTWYYTLLHTPIIPHTKILFATAYHLCKKKSVTKLSHSPQLHPCMLHLPFSTYKYDSKIVSIESDHFLLVEL